MILARSRLALPFPISHFQFLPVFASFCQFLPPGRELLFLPAEITTLPKYQSIFGIRTVAKILCQALSEALESRTLIRAPIKQESIQMHRQCSGDNCNSESVHRRFKFGKSSTFCICIPIFTCSTFFSI